MTADSGLRPALLHVARARGTRDGMRHARGETVRPPWSVSDPSLTKTRMAREWLDAFNSVDPPAAGSAD